MFVAASTAWLGTVSEPSVTLSMKTLPFARDWSPYLIDQEWPSSVFALEFCGSYSRDAWRRPRWPAGSRVLTTHLKVLGYFILRELE